MHPLLIFVTRGVSLGGGCRRTGGQRALLRAICAGLFQRPWEGGGSPCFFFRLFLLFIDFCHERTICFCILFSGPSMP